MAQITGKTIYVLGAGASQHTGAPLLRDFLVTARILREEKSELRYRGSFDRVFEWIDTLRGSSYYVEFDLDNLEHVFFLVEMSKQVGLAQGGKLFSDLRYVVMETLDQCHLSWRKSQLRPDDHYLTFAQILRKLNGQRRDYTGQPSGTFENDVIITFNYDVMLDYAMKFQSMEIYYCLDSGPGPDPFKVLKLHGSTSWAACRDCRGPAAR